MQTKKTKETDQNRSAKVFAANKIRNDTALMVVPEERCHIAKRIFK